MPPGLPSGYPVANGQPLYIDNFQPADGERRSKKRRGNLPKWQTDFMRAWYNDHLKNPYPTDEEKHMIMRETGLTLEQVSGLLPFLAAGHVRALSILFRSPIGSSIAGEDMDLR